jgi:cytochrome c peroxidase
LSQLALRAGAAPVAAAPAQDPARVSLGQALFFDRVLSGNKNISCYTCHDVGAATGDALSVSIGTGGLGGAANRQLADGTLIARNAPPLFRLAGQTSMFWDSRVSRRADGTLVTPEPALNGPNPAAAGIAARLTSALAAQAMFPPTSREEMRGQPGENEIADATTNLEVWALLMRRLVGSDDGAAPGIAEYRDLFAAAYPDVLRWSDFNFGHAAQAMAAFIVASFHPRGSPFDDWLGGNLTALSDQAKRGGILFYGRADCARCHGGPALTDGRHHAIGVPQVGPGRDFFLEDTGRGAITGDPADRYRFRTPSLRNVAITGPWMHDGAYTTLENVVRHYRDPEDSLRDYDRRQLSFLLQPLVDTDPARQAARALAISPLVRGGVRLNDQDVAQILAFFAALTDPDAQDLEDTEPPGVPSGLPIDDED